MSSLSVASKNGNSEKQQAYECFRCENEFFKQNVRAASHANRFHVPKEQRWHTICPLGSCTITRGGDGTKERVRTRRYESPRSYFDHLKLHVTKRHITEAQLDQLQRKAWSEIKPTTKGLWGPKGTKHSKRSVSRQEAERDLTQEILDMGSDFSMQSLTHELPRLENLKDLMSIVPSDARHRLERDTAHTASRLQEQPQLRGDVHHSVSPGVVRPSQSSEENPLSMSQQFVQHFAALELSRISTTHRQDPTDYMHLLAGSVLDELAKQQQQTSFRRSRSESDLMSVASTTSSLDNVSFMHSDSDVSASTASTRSSGTGHEAKIEHKDNAS